jgi:hypothetical protein
LLRDVGKLIGQPADSIAVRLVALARLKMDATEAQLLSGDPAVTVQDITALEEVFAKYVPKPGMNLKVSSSRVLSACSNASTATWRIALRIIAGLSPRRRIHRTLWRSRLFPRLRRVLRMLFRQARQT